MKALFVKQTPEKDRIYDFIITLNSRGVSTFEHHNLDDIDWEFFDIIIFDYRVPTYINKFEKELLNFKGKLFLSILSDSSSFEYEELKDTILERVNCWVLLQANEESFNKRNYNYKDKYVLIPRFTHQNIDSSIIEPDYNNKINKIVFIGRSTGGYSFNGKNYRVEGLKRIYNNSFLKNNFWGVLCDDKILDSDYQDIEYNKTFVYSDKEFWLNTEQWHTLLYKNTLNLAITGHTKFGYRHPVSLATKNVMVGTFDFTNDPYKWLFSEHFKDISYQVKEDFSDFEDVLTEAINNRERTKEYAYRGYELYKDYYELNPDNSYKDHIWKIVEDQFNKIGIEFY